jgi:hypothetical protein
MIRARIPHPHGADGARERLKVFFERKQIACTWDADGRGALVSKALPFVGEAQARVVFAADAVEVEMVQAPPFPSADTIQRLIVEELSRVLA